MTDQQAQSLENRAPEVVPSTSLARDGGETAELALEPARDRSKLSRPVLLSYQLLAIAVLIGIWQLIIALQLVNPRFLPGVVDVGRALYDMAGDGETLQHVWATMMVAIVGFVLGSAVGIAVGFLLGLLPRVNDSVGPILQVSNAAPRLALAPLFVLWFGIGPTAQIGLVFTVIVFIVLMNTIVGTQSVDRDHLLIARLQGATRRQIIRKVVVPSTAPWVIAAMRLAWVYAVSGAVVSQMFLGQEGLGYLISASSGFFQVDQVFAAIVLTVILAFLGDILIRLAERRVLRWRPAALSGGV